MLLMGGNNWVEGDQFFNREIDLELLERRMREGIHTLLTAQRRIGKTSLVRELMRRLNETGEYEIVFLNLEKIMDAADAMAELGVQAKSARGVSGWIKATLLQVMKGVVEQIDELSIKELRVKLRAQFNTGNWQHVGDDIFASLADSERPVILAIDEISMLVNRLLKDDGDRITPRGRRQADAFLSWLRYNGQEHRGKVTMILSDSVGLGPLLTQVGLTAQANIYSIFDVQPWSEETAKSFLGELAETYDIVIPSEVRQSMCDRLRCCIPHHVQMFFERLNKHLYRQNRSEATADDVEKIYLQEMLGVQTHTYMQHYESRLSTIFGKLDYTIALEILTYTATRKILDSETIRRYKEYYQAQENGDTLPVEHIVYALHHDGYLEPREDDGAYQFVSSFVEDWWYKRHSQYFVPVIEV